ncbi:uncharacterized protein C8A04DRAFT_15198 [Dichotomopilus funicola]|uniref:EamA domain-containing protein n=1 Tax=Dichotomopilus funicola TaxID=1934379 RepID=A0AAN6UW70_9PEZI|nr:hypothetical protein C8A04DRAFT_15198 [Dichotomopilus funicola]
MVLPADAHSADPLLTTTPADDDEDHTRRGRLSYHSSSQTTSASNSTTPSPGALRPHLGASSSTFTPSTSNPKPRPSSPLSPGPASATHRPHLSRRGTATSTTTIMMRSRSPALAAAAAARAEASRKYTYAAIFLVISLVSFTVQTMLASQIQHDLGWDKAYCMMYLTHGSWVCLWPLQLAVLRYQQRDGGGSWKRFMDNHVRVLRGIALVVETRDVRAAARMGGYQRHGHGHHHGSAGLLEYGHSPWPYLAKATAVITSALTVAGLSWYLAVSMTTPSDLTAIYNCSAFFAYAFSVPLLKERVRADKMLAVAVAIVGVLIVAYGDSGDSGSTSGSESEAQLQAPSDSDPGNNTPALDAGTRFAGNLIIGVGSVLYGLYEVLYKRYACPPDGMDATKGVIFANTFGSLMGAFTLLVLWIPLPILHVLGWETFEIPTGYTAWLLFVSVLMNMSFSGSFLVLISLTSPVLSSVASLLTIFMVALVDWFLTGTPVSGAALFGGLLIVTAFVMLSWSTWREMNEEERRKQVDLDSSGEED